MEAETTCDHRWVYIGMTTTCEPEIAHHACALCRTFRHTQLNERYRARGVTEPNRAWETKTWEHGPWTEENWQAVARGGGSAG